AHDCKDNVDLREAGGERTRARENLKCALVGAVCDRAGARAVFEYSPPKLGGVPRSGGAARSVRPIGRNLKICSKSRSFLLDIREAHLFQSERFAAIY